jgi:hypothetical protein
MFEYSNLLGEEVPGLMTTLAVELALIVDATVAGVADG